MTQDDPFDLLDKLAESHRKTPGEMLSYAIAAYANAGTGLDALNTDFVVAEPSLNSLLDNVASTLGVSKQDAQDLILSTYVYAKLPEAGIRRRTIKDAAGMDLVRDICEATGKNAVEVYFEAFLSFMELRLQDED